ncbi:MAG: DUF4097 family beta strand repeat-containing protein [Acidobacteriota bacterium]|nr:DUF4097 family beta strand repeat-containing protein [Acidobacteriota bacterium]MDH3786583.1 DUF4097 family beta strand repeat-containing protein [Acidobacteriota bacterium]
MKKITLIAALLLMALPLLAGTKTVDITRDATADADVSIELISGTIRVVVGSNSEVRIRGTVNDRWETVEVDGDDDDISIEVDLPSGTHNNVRLEADLEISVPAGVELSIETVSSEIWVEGLTGSVSVETVSGDIDIDGNMEEILVESVSGSIDIRGGKSTDTIEVELVSGTVEVSGGFNNGGDYSIGAVSGNITLRVPAGFGAEYEIETFSGSIKSDFGPTPKRAEYLPSKSLSFTEGNGSADVEIETFSGTIRLQKS